jgi:hypothetical protein
MANHPSDDDDDSVGYRRPPKETRWKKGQSGNPSGKRRRDESMSEKLGRLVREEIAVTQNGSQTVMPADEAMLRAAIHKAMKGDTRALKLLLDHIGKAVGGAASVPELVITDADIQVVLTQIDWLDILESARAKQVARDGDEPDSRDYTENDHGRDRLIYGFGCGEMAA